MTELEQANYRLMRSLESVLILMEVELPHMQARLAELRRAQEAVYEAQFAATQAANAALEEMLSTPAQPE